jgi:hypothetical protein
VRWEPVSPSIFFLSQPTRSICDGIAAGRGHVRYSWPLALINFDEKSLPLRRGQASGNFVASACISSRAGSRRSGAPRCCARRSCSGGLEADVRVPEKSTGRDRSTPGAGCRPRTGSSARRCSRPGCTRARVQTRAGRVAFSRYWGPHPTAFHQPRMPAIGRAAVAASSQLMFHITMSCREGSTVRARQSAAHCREAVPAGGDYPRRRPSCAPEAPRLSHCVVAPASAKPPPSRAGRTAPAADQFVYPQQFLVITTLQVAQSRRGKRHRSARPARAARRRFARRGRKSITR